MKLLLACLLLAACDRDDSVCDPDQSYHHGLCYDIDAPPAVAPFGTGCLFDEECPTGTNHCAIDSSTRAGICTMTGCDLAPAICPATWHCAAADQSTMCMP